MRSHWITVHHIKILYCDYSNLGLSYQVLLDEVNAVDKEILNQPKNSVMLLVNLQGTFITIPVVELFKVSAKRTKGYVKIQAVLLDLEVLKSKLADIVAKESDEIFHLFYNRNEALEFLSYSIESTSETNSQ